MTTQELKGMTKLVHKIKQRVFALFLFKRLTGFKATNTI